MRVKQRLENDGLVVNDVESLGLDLKPRPLDRVPSVFMRSFDFETESAMSRALVQLRSLDKYVI